jgi:hypothetical protein
LTAVENYSAKMHSIGHCILANEFLATVKVTLLYSSPPSLYAAIAFLPMNL